VWFYIWKEKRMEKLPRKQRVSDVAKRYSIGKSTVWKYIKDGKLTSIKISPRITVLDTVELEAFFNEDITEHNR